MSPVLLFSEVMETTLNEFQSASSLIEKGQHTEKISSVLLGNPQNQAKKSLSLILT